MTLTVTIEALGARGEGIATVSGKRVFVPFTLKGETAEIDVNDERGTLVSLQDASTARAEPFCPHFGSCGGCALQHAGPDVYADFKRGLVIEALHHRGIETDVSALIDARGEGRRRATFHATKTGAGFMRANSHDLLNIDACPILVPALRETAPDIARQIGAMIGDSDILFTATDTGLDVTVRPARTLRPERLVPLAQRLRLTRMALEPETIFQLTPPTLTMGRATVELPTGSFLQATAAAETVLTRLVVDAIDKPAGKSVGKVKHVADLFCGVGPFTLQLAEKWRVAAFDSDKPAVTALASAIRYVQGIKAVTTSARDLFRDPLAPVELEPFDAVVFDPPRAGAEVQSRELARSKVKTVVAVSCDPRSFARDAAILISGGYRLESVVPVDQFAWSPHVEVVGVFRR